ncbi:MAG: TrkA family potassium uptake protein [Candidatus Eisenbacteria bacterium]|nr:TrkA family potassium uptake protein [Candidatus Eisenbacteria bacterium]
MKRFAVIGLGLLGRTVARELAQRGVEIVAVDMDPQLVQSMADELPLTVRLDSTNKEALMQQGIDQVDAALVAIGENFEAAVLTTALLKEFGIKRVISRAKTEQEARILTLVQADEVILVEEMVARRLATRLMSPSLMDMVQLGPGMSLAKIGASKEMLGKTLSSLKFRQKYGLNVVAVIKADPEEAEGSATLLPDPNEVIEKGDVLLVDGPDEAIERLAGDEGE